MDGSYEVFALAIYIAWDLANDRLRQFLDKNNVKVWLSLKDSVDNKIVLANILRKDIEIFQNHICCLLPSKERINLTLFSQILAYFFWCYSLLNRCLQNGHWLESAWWLLLQLEHLKEWGHRLPFLVSRHGGFIFLFALQHHPNSRWFSDLCGPLHLMHLEPWILQEKIACPHFQQFLH